MLGTHPVCMQARCSSHNAPANTEYPAEGPYSNQYRWSGNRPCSGHELSGRCSGAAKLIPHSAPGSSDMIICLHASRRVDFKQTALACLACVCVCVFSFHSVHW